ncbi:MAG: hypothetical protein GY811_02710 [Myxococcales bacterium]|nr:hypothetical protein [Myxococcales bacterium]
MLNSKKGWQAAPRSNEPKLIEQFQDLQPYDDMAQLSSLSEQDLVTLSRIGPCEWAAPATEKLIERGVLDKIPGRPSGNDPQEFVARFCVAAYLGDAAAVRTFMKPDGVKYEYLASSPCFHRSFEIAASFLVMSVASPVTSILR